MSRLQARRRLLQQVKKQVEMKIGPPGAALRAYALPYEREASTKKFRISDKAELLAGINRSRVVYGSDFHAFSQAQRTHLKILRSLAMDRPIIIAMESLPMSSDQLTAKFVRGECSEADYLKAIRWEKEWGFPWEHYRPLFDLARDRGFEIIGLNKKSASADLGIRDRLAAERIAAVLRKQPKALVYIIFGEWHLADSHLPRAVTKALGTKPTHVKVYLNCEDIYFALARRHGATEIDVVKLNKQTYCVLSSPPWVQWQSYLMFLDQSAEIEMFDDTEDVDYTDRVSAIIDVITGDLGKGVGLKLKKNDLTVYSPRDEQIWTELRQRLSANEARVADAFIESSRSFLIPQAGVIYLARASVNTASEMAGQYVHARLSKRKLVFGAMPEDFERFIWIKAVGYFLSKLINPKRQAKTLRDLQNESLDPGDDKESKTTLRLALDQRMTEIVWSVESRRRRRRIVTRQRSGYDQAARILGDMLGERLYLAVRARRLNSKRLMTLLKYSVEAPGFSRFYQNLVAELEPVAIRMKDKKERL